MAERQLSGEMVQFLLTKIPVRLDRNGVCVGYDVKQHDDEGFFIGMVPNVVDGGADSLPAFATYRMLAHSTQTSPARACTRPIWGDGTVDGVRFDLCSKCWHCWAAFHSGYRLMQANPAASQIDDVGLERLFVGRKMDGEQGCEKCQCGRKVPDESIVCAERGCPHSLSPPPEISAQETSVYDEPEAHRTPDGSYLASPLEVAATAFICAYMCWLWPQDRDHLDACVTACNDVKIDYLGGLIKVMDKSNVSIDEARRLFAESLRVGADKIYKLYGHDTSWEVED